MQRLGTLKIFPTVTQLAMKITCAKSVAIIYFRKPSCKIQPKIA